MEINTTTVKQTANELLGKTESSLYYLVIKNKNGKKMVINVGQKTHDSVQELLKDEQTPIQEPRKGGKP